MVRLDFVGPGSRIHLVLTFEQVHDVMARFVPVESFTLERVKANLDASSWVQRVPQYHAYGWRGCAEVAGLAVVKLLGVPVVQVPSAYNFVKELAKLLDRGYRERALRPVIAAVLEKWVDKGLDAESVVTIARFVLAIHNENRTLEQIRENAQPTGPQVELPDLSPEPLPEPVPAPGDSPGITS